MSNIITSGITNLDLAAHFLDQPLNTLINATTYRTEDKSNFRPIGAIIATMLISVVAYKTVELLNNYILPYTFKSSVTNSANTILGTSIFAIVANAIYSVRENLIENPTLLQKCSE